MREGEDKFEEVLWLRRLTRRRPGANAHDTDSAPRHEAGNVLSTELRPNPLLLDSNLGLPARGRCATRRVGATIGGTIPNGSRKPEAFEAGAALVDQSSDIYSWGSSLRLLTLHHLSLLRPDSRTATSARSCCAVSEGPPRCGAPTVPSPRRPRHRQPCLAPDPTAALPVARECSKITVPAGATTAYDNTPEPSMRENDSAMEAAILA